MTASIDLDTSAPPTAAPKRTIPAWSVLTGAASIVAAILWASYQLQPTPQLIPEPTPLQRIVVDVQPADDGPGSWCFLQVGDRTWHEYTDRQVCEWDMPLGAADPYLVP